MLVSRMSPLGWKIDSPPDRARLRYRDRLGEGAFGQLANFLGHHHEALAVFAGAGRLDGGVEGQDVGSVGDPRDDLGDLADLAAVLGDFFDDAEQLAGGKLATLDQLGRHDAFLLAVLALLDTVRIASADSAKAWLT